MTEAEQRECRVCHRVLPLTRFRPYGDKRRMLCRHCESAGGAAEATSCGCGCGVEVLPPARFQQGHHTRINVPGRPEATTLQRRRARQVSLSERAKQALGGRCVRCGIAAPLCWDHINNDGHQYKSAGGNRLPTIIVHKTELRHIVNTGASVLLQLLCFNCNALKQWWPELYAAPPTYGPLEDR